VIITLANVKSILQIPTADTSQDTLISLLIPEIQKSIVRRCNNSFLNTDVQLSASTISFTTTTIIDSDNHFIDEGYFFNGMDLKAYGSKLNDGIYEIKTVAAGTLTTETAITQCQPTRVEAAENEIILTMVDFSKVNKFDVAMLINYALTKQGKGVKSESLPGGYSVTYKDENEVWSSILNQHKRL
jgi:kynurenine formamidase